MKSLWLNLVRTSLVAVLSLIGSLSASGQDEAPGVVRISQPSTAQAQAKQIRPVSFRGGLLQHGGSQFADNPSDFCESDASCRHGFCFGAGGCCRGPRCDKQDIANYFRCKLGYFIPTGAGGAGVPFCGKYARVYPQDPHYFDQRDGQAWAAQGYGAPMAVPLAPVVGHTYNYGWGTPSSRLTPISRPAY